MQVVTCECALQGQGQQGGRREWGAQRMQWVKEETEMRLGRGKESCTACKPC